MPLTHIVTLMPVSYVAKSEATVLAYAVLRALVILPTWPLSGWLDWPSLGVVSAAFGLSLFAAAAVWRHVGRWRTERTSDRIGSVRAP